MCAHFGVRVLLSRKQGHFANYRVINIKGRKSGCGYKLPHADFELEIGTTDRSIIFLTILDGNIYITWRKFGGFVHSNNTPIIKAVINFHN